jgi:hypothetical protein
MGNAKWAKALNKSVSAGIGAVNVPEVLSMSVNTSPRDDRASRRG